MLLTLRYWTDQGFSAQTGHGGLSQIFLRKQIEVGDSLLIIRTERIWNTGLTHNSMAKKKWITWNTLPHSFTQQSCSQPGCNRNSVANAWSSILIQCGTMQLRNTTKEILSFHLYVRWEVENVYFVRGELYKNKCASGVRSIDTSSEEEMKACVVQLQEDAQGEATFAAPSPEARQEGCCQPCCPRSCQVFASAGMPR